MSIEQDLLSLKRKIEQAKSDQARAEGALEETQKRLKTEFGFATLAEVDAELVRLDEEIQRAEADLAEQVRVMKETYNV